MSSIDEIHFRDFIEQLEYNEQNHLFLFDNEHVVFHGTKRGYLEHIQVNGLTSFQMTEIGQMADRIIPILRRVKRSSDREPIPWIHHSVVIALTTSFKEACLWSLSSGKGEKAHLIYNRINLERSNLRKFSVPEVEMEKHGWTENNILTEEENALFRAFDELYETINVEPIVLVVSTNNPRINLALSEREGNEEEFRLPPPVEVDLIRIVVHGMQEYSKLEIENLIRARFGE